MTATTTAKSGVRSVPGAPLLELEDVKMHFKTKGDGFLSRRTQWVQAVDGVGLTVQARRDARTGRRVRLWQVPRPRV